MFFREAKITDIEQMHQVRLAVRENVLSDPNLISTADYQEMLARGKGWVCEVDEGIAGFAVVDLQEARIWALFVRPELEGNFIGRMLHDMMVTWCFSRGVPKLWLTTDPNTRAEKFYLKAGWTKTGLTANGEVRFELEDNLDI
jgi:GNAT superfamily N-acetyltransferase